MKRTQSGDAWIFQYDQLGSLVQIDFNGVTKETYRYDGLGRRVVEGSGSSEKHIIFLNNAPLYEKDLSTLETRYHICANGYRIAVVESDGSSYETVFPFHDILGSTRMALSWDSTTQSHTIEYEAAHKPFGIEHILLGTGNQEKYLGKERPNEAGLYWFGARYYDPEVDRFYGMDPILGHKGVPQSLNRYAYSINNPVSLSDPEGADFVGDVGQTILGSLVCLATLPICMTQFITGSVDWLVNRASWQEMVGFLSGIAVAVATGIGVGLLCAATIGVGCIAAAVVGGILLGSVASSLTYVGVTRALGGHSHPRRPRLCVWLGGNRRRSGCGLRCQCPRSEILPQELPAQSALPKRFAEWRRG